MFSSESNRNLIIHYKLKLVRSSLLVHGQHHHQPSIQQLQNMQNTQATEKTSGTQSTANCIALAIAVCKWWLVTTTALTTEHLLSVSIRCPPPTQLNSQPSSRSAGNCLETDSSCVLKRRVNNNEQIITLLEAIML